jgi:hypothetical protein
LNAGEAQPLHRREAAPSGDSATTAAWRWDKPSGSRIRTSVADAASIGGQPWANAANAQRLIEMPISRHRPERDMRCSGIFPSAAQNEQRGLSGAAELRPGGRPLVVPAFYFYKK